MTAPLAWIPTKTSPKLSWNRSRRPHRCVWSVEIVEDGIWFGQAMSKDGEVQC